VTFADAWRITNDTSLFDYAPGESTEITIKNFPAEPDVVTLADLTPEQRAAGEARCKNIGISFLHDMCVFDVGYTGVDIFGDIYDITADVVDNGQLTGSAERVRIVNLYVNDDGSTPALDVYGWTPDGPTLVGTVEYEHVGDFFDTASCRTSSLASSRRRSRSSATANRSMTSTST